MRHKLSHICINNKVGYPFCSSEKRIILRASILGERGFMFGHKFWNYNQDDSLYVKTYTIYLAQTYNSTMHF